MWSPAQYPGPLESGNFCIRHVLFGGNPCRPSTTLKVMWSIGSLRWLRPIAFDEAWTTGVPR